VASLPWSPLVVLGLWRGLGRGPGLPRFAACWLLAVLLLFSVSATKLPSYWLPATPAAALLAASVLADRDAAVRWCVRLGALCSLSLGLALLFTPQWLTAVGDPDLVGLDDALAASGLLWPAVLLLSAGGCTAAWLSFPRRVSNWSIPVLAVQLSWLLFVPGVLLPLLRIGDALRSQPIRCLALRARELQSAQQANGQPIALIGEIRPSFHFYSRAPIAYEGTEAQELVNLDDRLRREPRLQAPQPSDRILVAAPLSLAQHRHWAALLSRRLAQQGRYGLWWLDRCSCRQVASASHGHRRDKAATTTPVAG
jgi:4-amino-4-deoxy-L-arabinose transferase-like glycosyltransferase